MKNVCAIIVLLLLVTSCKQDSKISKDVLEIPLELNVERFDKDLAKSTAEDVSSLQKKYPYFFSSNYDVSYWKSRVVDTLQKEIEREVLNQYENIDDIQEDITLVFKHIKYYFPEYKVPSVITVASDVDYRNKVILTDSLLFLSFSNYLGEDHYFYDGIARYRSKNMRQDQVVVDIAHAFAKAKTPRIKSKEFLDHLIYEGKKLYLMRQLLPELPEYEILGYTEDEWIFAKENQVNIWEYFVSNKLLFDTDRKLLSRFIDPAPFSKFYLDIDNDSPGRIGRYVGYKIVESYMNENTVDLKNMLLQDATSIFNGAKYKP